VIFVILFAGLVWISNYTSDPLRAMPRPIIALFVTAIAFSILYLLWLRYWPNLVWQVRVQFAVDALLITWLVGETGDLISPYITLYIFLISVAGFYLRKNEVHFVAAFCSLCFIALSLLTSQSLVYSISGDVTITRGVQIVLINVGAFLLVGLLAGRLAERGNLRAELKRTEEEFADLNVLHERILSSINSGLITTDLQGKIRAFNRAAEEATGLKAKDAIGRSLFSVLGDEIRHPIEMSLSGVQNVEFSPPNFEASLLDQSKNGDRQRVIVACSVSPLIGRSGGVTGLIISFQDKTELHAMEESLRRADRLSAVGRMAAGLAHEIRNPLGSISSAVQFLSEKDSNTDDRKELMGVVVRESDRLNKIIADFLSYARPEVADGSMSRVEMIDVRKTIDDCVSLIRHDPIVKDTHEFVVDAPQRPVTIVADESKLKQVCWNLMHNAIRAMPEGGRLSITIDEPTEKQVRLVFKDNGVGIESDNLSNIFEPFQSGAHGTGLGLSIVHRIVTESGGRIEIKSEKGVGTSIVVDLPK